MIGLSIILDGDHAWPELAPDKFVRGELEAVARLPMGTDGGRSTVTLRIKLPNGNVVLAETTLRLLDNAVIAMKARDEMEAGNGPGH